MAGASDASAGRMVKGIATTPLNIWFRELRIITKCFRPNAKNATSDQSRMRISLRLGKKQENARSSGCHQLMLSFLVILGNGQAVAVFVLRWNAINQEHITVGAVSGDS